MWAQIKSTKIERPCEVLQYKELLVYLSKH